MLHFSRNDVKAHARPPLTIYVDGVEVRPEGEGNRIGIGVDVSGANRNGKYRYQHCLRADN